MADPRQTLHDLIRRFGFSLAQDPQKCDRVMKVLCGNSGAQVSAIVAAIEDKIPTELVQNQSNWHDIRGDLIYRFKENRKLNHELALWTVDTWGLVLGIWSQRDLDGSNLEKAALIRLEPISNLWRQLTSMLIFQNGINLPYTTYRQLPHQQKSIPMNLPPPE